MYTGMCRSGQIVLQAIQHAPAVDIGQRNVEQDRVRLVVAGQGDAGRAQRRDQAFEADFAGDFQGKVRKAQVVVDDQHHAVAGLRMSLRSSFASVCQCQRFAACSTQHRVRTIPSDRSLLRSGS